MVWTHPWTLGQLRFSTLDALYHLKSWQLLQNCTRNRISKAIGEWPWGSPKVIGNCNVSLFLPQRVDHYCQFGASFPHRPHIAKTTRHNFTQFLYMWFGSPLTAMLYFRLCTSGFVNDVMCSHYRANGQNERQRVCFVEYARWRHREQSLPSPTVSCYFTACSSTVGSVAIKN